MARFYREAECYPIQRKHCRTCVCQDVDPVRRLSSPRINPYRSRYTSVRHQGCCRRCHHSPVDDWEENEIMREHHHGFSSTKVARKTHSDHKFAVLEKWFKQFDFDGNGLIDVYELQQLLKHLDVKCDQNYVKDLIEDADRDHDGMLSFSEFLHMWSQAASEDIENLTNLIKEHDLYPDIPPSTKYNVKSNLGTRRQHIKEIRNYDPHPEYPCCNVVPKRKTFKRNPVKAREVQIKSKVKHSISQCSDDFPVLSSHR